MTGPGVSCPSAHSEASRIFREMYSISSRSARRSLALRDARQDFQQPLPADAAGDALPARFRRGKGQEVAGKLDHAGIFVDHDHAARAHRRPGFDERVRNRPVYPALMPAGSRPAGRRSARL